MRSLHRFALAAVATAAAGSAGLFLGFVGASPVEVVVEFSAVTLGAVLVSAFAIPRAGATAGTMMPPSFVFTFAALLLFGPNTALLVAAAAGAAAAVVQWRLAHPLPRILTNVATVVAIAAAAWLHRVLGG